MGIKIALESSNLHHTSSHRNNGIVFDDKIGYRLSQLGEKYKLNLRHFRKSHQLNN